MKLNHLRWNALALTAVCGIAFSNLASADESILSALNNQPLGIMAPQQRAAHGGVDGAGGDGLELTSVAETADVEISVPSDLGASGTLEVVGVPGAGQKDEVWVVPCDSDASGEPVEYGSHADKGKTIHLNQPTSLLPGSYKVYYSKTEAVVQVRAEEKTTAELKKLKVAKADRPVSFSVFRDFTDQSMQELLLKDVWTNSGNLQLEQRYCQTPSAQNQQACDALKSGNYHELLDRGIQFNADGSFSTWYMDLGKFKNAGRDYVTDPEAGQFVSVFPGVYGVVFTDNQTGKSETRYGIRVR